MRTWRSAIALGAILLGVLGCEGPKAFLGLYPTAVIATESVDQKLYSGSSLPELHEAALEVLHSLKLEVLRDRQHQEHNTPARVLEAERTGGETVRLLLSPQDGEDVLVSIQVRPPESTLAAEIQTELAARLLPPRSPGTAPP